MQQEKICPSHRRLLFNSNEGKLMYAAVPYAVFSHDWRAKVSKSGCLTANIYSYWIK